MVFHAGEVVQLKSGGPAMTVVSADEQGVHCVWYGEVNDEIHSGVIAAVALETVHIEDDEDEDEHEDGHKRHE